VKKTYAVDLDGTLAEYHGWTGNNHIGEPIPAMLARVQQWLKDGIEVVIFTARADNAAAKDAVRAWLKEHGLPALRVTNVKLPEFGRIYDDRAIQVRRNQGTLVSDQSEPEKRSPRIRVSRK
jgi:hypothetical protein